MLGPAGSEVKGHGKGYRPGHPCLVLECRNRDDCLTTLTPGGVPVLVVYFPTVACFWNGCNRDDSVKK